MSGAILQELHDSGINASVATFYDGIFFCRIGDSVNGYLAEANLGSWAESVRWLEETASRIYPDSEFARMRIG
ncbi:MAG: hypothetical protein ACREFC_12650 [Stellaceae bacterium]